MEYYPMNRDDLPEGVRSSNKKEVYKTLLEIMKTNISLCRVEDDYYYNHNDLRRAIQSVIKVYDLPLRVFMRCGKVYVEKEDK